MINILVIGPSWIGDMMMSHSLYRTIKSQYPEAVIDVMAPDWCRSLLLRMPEVNKGLLLPFKHGELALKKRFYLGKFLQKNGLYDRAYILPNSFKSALVPFFAKIKRRIGWRGEMRYGLLNDIRVLDKSKFPLMVERYIALAYDQPVHSSNLLPKPLLWPRLKVEENEKRLLMQQFILPSDKLIIGFCPGAEFGPAKCWPYYYYALLAEQLIYEGYQVILLGAKKERKIGQAIIQTLSNTTHSHCSNLIGHTKLEEAVILISLCTAIVSNDSGLMHIAAALNCPIVALYGPSSPNFTPPLSNKTRIIHLSSHYDNIRTGNTKDGYHQSMINILPKLVYQELNTLLYSIK
ncbi:ADP-heptose--LPS heptosyltransferase II RfaF [Candidatus Pantoea carbekii]|nr:ADP-heptose--LPS heptosyltransferase II RfaF [Candidatus Pantoea carbekii]